MNGVTWIFVSVDGSMIQAYMCAVRKHMYLQYMHRYKNLVHTE